MRTRLGACLAVLVTSLAAPASEPATPLGPWLDSAVDAAGQAGCTQLAVVEPTGDAGPLGRYLTARLEAALMGGARDRWRLADGRSADSALRAAGVSPEQLANPRQVARALAGLGIDGLVITQVRHEGERIRVASRLLHLPDGPPGELPLLDLPLDADLLALGGESYAVDEQRGLRPKIDEAVKLAREPDRLPPVLDARCPFRLELLVGGQPRTAERRGREAAVRVARGETYALRLTNRTQQRVGVALFIDGLNSVGQQRELPSAGLKWILEPGEVVEVAGWQLGNLRRAFTVVEPGRSVAGRQGLADQLGLVTASFYAEAEPAAGGLKVGGEERRDLPLGTGEGASERADVTKVRFRAADTPAATLVLRYEVAEARIGG